MSTISTHVLDTALGKPAEGVRVTLERDHVLIGSGETDEDGRVRDLLQGGSSLGEGEYKLTFTQEKTGFAEAALSKGAAKVATLTVSDTEANPSARDKFKASVKKIGEFPAVANGSQGTAVLVANRYQVQARSLTPAFTEADREAWLHKFKLSHLAEMK